MSKNCKECVHFVPFDNCGYVRVSLRKTSKGELLASPQCKYEFFEPVVAIPTPVVEEKVEVAPTVVKFTDETATLVEDLKEKNPPEVKHSPKTTNPKTNKKPTAPRGRPKKG